MPLCTFRETFELDGQRYGPGLVDVSDHVYLAARRAGVLGQPEEPSPTRPAAQAPAKARGGAKTRGA